MKRSKRPGSNLEHAMSPPMMSEDDGDDFALSRDRAANALYSKPPTGRRLGSRMAELQHDDDSWEDAFVDAPIQKPEK